MKEPGYIYIMVNPSIEGRVKIGKTTRDSRLRAKELSQATGVATPFYVAFSVEVDDCHSAEKYVHSILKSKGFDRSPNREFFEIPLRDAIEVLIRAEKEFPKQTRTLPDVKQAAPLSSDINADAELFSRQLGIATFKKAVSAYYGFGDELEDKREALRLFNEAKALNFAPAYNALSEYFLREANEVNNSAARELRGKALDVLKEGTQKGHGCCYIKMAEMYTGCGATFDPGREPQNATKCWKKYFQSSAFINDDDVKWNCDVSFGGIGIGESRVYYAKNYLFQVFLGLIPFDIEIRQILLPLRVEIFEEITDSIKYLSDKKQSGWLTDEDRQKSLISDNQFLTFVESKL